MKFTDKYILNMKPKDKMYQVRESEGFGIRVLPSGLRLFIFIYTIAGKRRQMNLGDYPDVSLATAKDRAGDARKALKNGKDPQEVGFEWHRNPERDKREAARLEEEERKNPSVEDLCKEYIKRHAKRFKRSWAKDERILNFDVVPAWGKRKAKDIMKRDVVLLLEEIVKRGSPGMANNTFQIIRKMFNWSVEQDILTNTPCIGVKLPAPKQSRERVLTEAEIKIFWSNLDDCAISGEIRKALQLILLTAQRPGEVIGMHTAEIDGNWWTIPAERSKSSKANRVYLAPLAQEIIAEEIQEIKRLRELPPEVDYKGFIFPSPIKQKVQSINGQALVVAVARNLAFPLTNKDSKPLYQKDGKPATENRIGVDKFTPHDLRRTAATFMAEQGEMDEVIDAILNHAKQGVIKVYNQYRYDREKKMALETWERKLNSMITGKESNVLPMKRKTA